MFVKQTSGVQLLCLLLAPVQEYSRTELHSQEGGALRVTGKSQHIEGHSSLQQSRG